MSGTSHPVSCERVRGQVSLELDCELSQLERAMLAAHAVRCADCRAYRTEVRAFTRELRTAPLEAAPAISVRRYGRTVASRIQAGVAAAMALAVVGVGSQAVQSRHDGASFSTLRVSHFESQQEIEREQQLIQGSDAGSGNRTSGEATVR
jgi:hypothetical protein